MNAIKGVVLLVIILVLSQSCSKDDEAGGESTKIAIGDFYEGGIVFYLDDTGEHGYVCAMSNQGFDIEWGCPSASGFGAEGLVIGTGKENTVEIVDRCSEIPIAASLCDDLISNDYNDWFLPSKDELDALYMQKAIVNQTALDNDGGILYDGEYWSSSHDNSNTVWKQSFNAGNQVGALKDEKYYVRAIRAF